MTPGRRKISECLSSNENEKPSGVGGPSAPPTYPLPRAYPSYNYPPPLSKESLLQTFSAAASLYRLGRARTPFDEHANKISLFARNRTNISSRSKSVSGNIRLIRDTTNRCFTRLPEDLNQWRKGFLRHFAKNTFGPAISVFRSSRLAAGYDLDSFFVPIVLRGLRDDFKRGCEYQYVEF